MSVTIVPYQPEMYSQVLRVLRDGSLSNLRSAFRMTFNSPMVRVILLILPSLTYILTRNPLITVFTTLGLFIVLLLVVGGCIVLYTFGPRLDDVHKIQEVYMMPSRSTFFVALCNGRVAGTVAIQPKMECFHSVVYNKAAWLRRMAVHRDFRGLGIGRQLVAACVLYCKEHNYEAIELITTGAHPEAQRLYETSGFRKHSVRIYRYFGKLIPIETHEYIYYLRKIGKKLSFKN